MRILLQSLHELRTILQQRCDILALHHHLRHRVELDRAHHLLLVVALLSEISHEDLSELYSMTRTSSEVHLDTVTVDTVEQGLVEQGLHRLLRDHVALQLEAQRVDTLVQNVECLLVGLSSISHFDVLTNIPHVGVLLITTHERELSGESVGGLQICQVFAAIEGLHIKTFICSPYQALLEVGTFQVDLDLVHC